MAIAIAAQRSDGAIARFTRSAIARLASATMARVANAAAAIFVALLAMTGTARAGDPVVGMALFNDIPDAVISCGNSSCHGPNPNDNVNGLQRAGNNAGVIDAAIRLNVPAMMFLSGLLRPLQLEDLAAYLAPQPDLGASALDFGTLTVGSPGTRQSITLRNLGGVDLQLVGVDLSGPDATSFALSGSCRRGGFLPSAIINRPGGSCDVVVTFVPTAVRAHQAALTLGYAGSTTFPSRQTIALAGAGAGIAVPAIVIDPLAIDFGEVVKETAAPTRSVRISNPGSAPLQIASIETNGRNGAEFGLSGSCVEGISSAPVKVAPGASCTLNVSFSPQGSGAREGAISIRHNAAAAASVVLAGTGVAPTCAPPAPAAEFRTLACASGQNGSITQSRVSVCSGVVWTAGPWTTLADNCRSDHPLAPLELVEFFNAPLDHYFITADPAESAGIEAGLAGPGWVRTQVIGRVWEVGAGPNAAPGEATPVCRFYGNPGIGPGGKRIGPNSHFYTADRNECAAVKGDAGWVFEGTVFDAGLARQSQCAPPLVPVRRSYNLRFLQNDSNHRYATDPAIVEQMTARGWRDEGVVYCVAPK